MAIINLDHNFIIKECDTVIRLSDVMGDMTGMSLDSAVIVERGDKYILNCHGLVATLHQARGTVTSECDPIPDLRITLHPDTWEMEVKKTTDATVTFKLDLTLVIKRTSDRPYRSSRQPQSKQNTGVNNMGDNEAEESRPSLLGDLKIEISEQTKLGPTPKELRNAFLRGFFITAIISSPVVYAFFWMIFNL